jgi:5-methylcytosine-specific restriction enzyme subunit McrC
MKIPVQNIYYLLCYAWDRLEERDVVNVRAEGPMEWADLFARVLINGTTHLLKKGLDRDYRSLQDQYEGIKGKLLFDLSIKMNLIHSAAVYCEYDDLEHNVLHNQILKTTLGRLLRLNELDDKLRDDILPLYTRFPGVTEIALESRHFSQVKLHRNNYFYDFLLKVCRIIFESVLIREGTGESRFGEFVQDERMGGLFEEFVRNFYKKELESKYKVGRDHIHWALTKSGEDDKYLPLMKTDISLLSKEEPRKIVVETKCYSSGFKASAWLGSQEKLISGNLYQMFSYLKNLEQYGGVNETCEGILLYATVEENIDRRFYFPQHTVRVKTLDLGRPWEQISNDLRQMIQ